MKETDPIRDQALRRGAALANNVMRYYHALFELRRLSLILFSQGPARDSDIEAWLRQEDFGPREGFWLNRSLLERFRSGTAPGDAISHSWSETLKDYRDARFRMYCLRDIGPHLLEIHSHLPSAAWLYYQDVTNTSIQFPYIDQMEAIEPSFDWSTYHTFQAVEPGANPGRDIKWTPPTIDYAGEGLIISVSIPVYQGDEFIGLWSIDVPMALLYQEYITETVFPDQDNFIINNEGDIVVHKDIRANIDREKGSVFLEKVSALGGDFRSLNPGELMDKGRGGLTLRMADGRELLAYYKSIPKINWIFIAAVPRDRMLDVVNTRVRDALERVKIGDFTHRIEECSGMEQTRLLVEGYNEMVSALQAQEAVRLRAMEAIRESEERYRGFFEDNLSGAFISKPGGELIAYNPAFARIFGFESAADAKEIGFNALYPDPASYSDFLDLLRRERRLEHYEGMMRGMDGATINTLENIIGVFDDHGDLMEIRGYLIDVTDRKQLEGQLRQAQKMESIGTLAGGIAHDFNNILTSILGYSELALFDLPGGHPALEKVKEILRAGERARDLVKQILTFSRQGERSQRPVFMHIIVKEVYKMLRSSLPSTIDIRLDVTPSGKVLADPTSIHQVAMNLCTNAFQAMRGSGGVLDVRLAPVTIAAGEAEKHAGLSPGPHVLLTVSDTGPGMDRTTLERIFDPYFTTKKKNEGTGLGLSVVHGIIKSLDGAINVVSAPGEGAVFDVYLPRTDVDEEDEIAFSKDVPGGRERILIVDDEKDVIRVEVEMLERLGYKTTACNGGVAALQTFRDDPFAFDLVITDFTMPIMTGDKLTVELLEIRPDIPVILCTGFSQAVNEKAALSIGVRKFIMKPITIEKIAIAIREALAPRASA